MAVKPVLALLAAVACLRAPAGDDPAVRAEADIRALADTMKRAVEAHDVRAVLELVHESGLPSGDTVIPRAEVESDLQPGGRLHGYLFDPGQYSREPHALDRPMSLPTFFRRAEKVLVAVGLDDNGRGGRDFESGCATYRAANIAFAPHLCFHKIRGRWYLSRGLYEWEL